MLAVGAARRAHRDRPLRPHRSANLSSALPAPAALAGLEVRFAMALARVAAISRLASARRPAGAGRIAIVLLASLVLHLWWLDLARRELDFELPPPSRTLSVELFTLPAPVSVSNAARPPAAADAAAPAARAGRPAELVGAPITPPADTPPADTPPADTPAADPPRLDETSTPKAAPDQVPPPTVGSDLPPGPVAAAPPSADPRLGAVAVSFPRLGRFVSDTTVAQGLLRLLGSTSIEWRIADGRYSAKSDTYDDSGRVYAELTSEGRIDPGFGVAPERYVEKRLNRAPVATNFQWGEGKVTFSNNNRELPLRPGLQDQLSFLAQLALIAQAFPERLQQGGGLALEVVGTRDLRLYELAVIGWERLSLPVGTVDTLKLMRILPGESRDVRIELWLSPAHGWLPARTRAVLPDDRMIETVLREVKLAD